MELLYCMVSWERLFTHQAHHDGFNALHLAAAAGWDVPVLDSLVHAIRGFGDGVLRTVLHTRTKNGHIPSASGSAETEHKEEVNAYLNGVRAELDERTKKKFNGLF
eukprot:m.1307697 g.1307697  ORF g.1307697 m.1307697 type:complete len:106 (-) comp24818_c0_seq20:3633-3950(-)